MQLFIRAHLRKFPPTSEIFPRYFGYVWWQSKRLKPTDFSRPPSNIFPPNACYLPNLGWLDNSTVWFKWTIFELYIPYKSSCHLFVVWQWRSDTITRPMACILMTALAWEVMQLPTSVYAVRPSVCFHSIFGTDWPLTLNICMQVGRDHSSHGIIDQGHRSRSRSWVRLMWSDRRRSRAVFSS